MVNLGVAEIEVYVRGGVLVYPGLLGDVALASIETCVRQKGNKLNIGSISCIELKVFKMCVFFIIITTLKQN